MDESGLQDLPEEGTQVVGVKGQPALQIVSQEKGQTSTVLMFVSASGLVLSPMVIFKGQRVQAVWREFCPDGIQLAATPKGYITSEIFFMYSSLFVQRLREKKIIRDGRKILLLLDGHASHLFNLPFMENMVMHGVEVATLPPPHNTPPATIR